MRVLALAAWWPEPPDNGIRLRIAHLLRALAHEHEVHLVALSQRPVQPAERERLERIVASARETPERSAPLTHRDVIASLWKSEPASVRATWNAEFDRLAQERAAAVQPDVVLAFELSVAPYARRIASARRVLDALEVAYLLEQYTRATRRARKARAWLTWWKHRRYVRQTLADFAACAVPSAKEQAYVRAIASRSMPVAVIANGADVAGCADVRSNPEPDTLIYPGALSYDANFDAMLYFLGDVFPAIRAARPNARLRITGQADADRRARLPAADGVEFTGYVPDVRPLVAQSWAEVVPLRKGGGTRLKILEALALGTPVVSTAKGVEGLELDADRHVLIADGAAEFAAATGRLLSQPDLRARLAEAGRQIVRERYDWRVIGQRLNDLIRSTNPHE